MLEVCIIKFSLSDCNFSLTLLERDVLLSMPSLNPVEFFKQAHSNGTFIQARIINQPNRQA